MSWLKLAVPISLAGNCSITFAFKWHLPKNKTNYNCSLYCICQENRLFTNDFSYVQLFVNLISLKFFMRNIKNTDETIVDIVTMIEESVQVGARRDHGKCSAEVTGESWQACCQCPLCSVRFFRWVIKWMCGVSVWEQSLNAWELAAYTLTVCQQMPQLFAFLFLLRNQLRTLLCGRNYLTHIVISLLTNPTYDFR